MVHTYWSSARNFMDAMAGKTEKARQDPSMLTFRELIKSW